MAKIKHHHIPADELRDIIITALEDEKAEHIVEIDLEGKADFARYMVIANGRSSKHITSMAAKLIKKLKDNGLIGLKSEGEEKGDWILIDAFEVVVHLFKPEVREVYDIEKIWGFHLDRNS